MIVIVPHPPPTPEAVELGTKISDLVRLMREENSRIRPQDVRVAFRIAEQDLRGEIGGRVAPRVLIVMAALIGVAVLGAFLAKSQNQDTGMSLVWPMIGVGVLTAVLVAVAVLRK